MGLASVIRNAVAVADKVTQDLQALVTLRHVISSNSSGDITWGDPVSLHALVDWKQKHLRTQSGELTVSRASVLFVDVTELLAATNNDGIDDNDIITLPDGTTGPILDMSGFIDAGTGRPFATEVFLG